MAIGRHCSTSNLRSPECVVRLVDVLPDMPLNLVGHRAWRSAQTNCHQGVPEAARASPSFARPDLGSRPRLWEALAA